MLICDVRDEFGLQVNNYDLKVVTVETLTEVYTEQNFVSVTTGKLFSEYLLTAEEASLVWRKIELYSHTSTMVISMSDVTQVTTAIVTALRASRTGTVCYVSKYVVRLS